MDIIKETEPDFFLSKWYMDCIDADGNVFIGYSAALKWGKIKLNYANILLCDNQRNPQSQATFKKLPSPTFRNNHLTWTPSKLGTRGTWNSIDAPISKTLLNSDSGIIHWHCYQPKSNANVTTGNKHNISGFGYAEKLEMTIKPWELPFSELRCGRFLSEEDTIIWVNWRGDTNLNLVYYQGRPIKNAIVSDENINLGEFLLTFSDKIILREGPLISTAISNFPGMTSVFPNKILKTYECKWRSRGILEKENNKVSTGWLIHELVRWH